MTEDDNNSKHISSKIISIQSTSDGDIQTVTEETTVEQSNNLQISPIRDESVRAFKNHLRDSWDEVVDVPSSRTTTTPGDDNNNGKEGSTSGVEEGTKQKKTRHKQNLSVQFLDFNISEDSNVTNFTLSGINNNDAVNDSGERRKKETITGSFRFGETSQDSTTSTTTKVVQNKGNNTTETTTLSQSQNDMTNFTNNLQNSWKNETTTDDVKDGNNNKASFVSVKQVSNHHKPNNQSVQFLDSTIMEYSNDVVKQSNNDNTEDTNVSTKVKDDVSSQMSSSESAQQQLQQPPSERERLGSDSPISPYSSEKNDIVVPIPLRSNAPNSGNVGGGGVNRKHRRVFSGRSNPAMSHRRVNTRGDKHAPTREFKFDGGLVGSDDQGEQQQQQQQQKKKAFNAPNSEQLLSPASQAMPPPIPPQQMVLGQQPQNGPQQHYPPPPPPMAPPHPAYYHGTPPPSYDPYNVYGQHHPPGAYYNASPQSDAGVNYNTNRASPVVSTAGQQAPLAQIYPSQQQQQAFHNSNTPLSTQSAPDGCYTFTERDVSMSSSSNSQPPNLEQPLLDNNNNTTSHHKAGLKIHTDEKLFGGSGTNDQGGSKQQHRKDPSLNPLPFNDNGHHRKQSSLGSFLATAELFDDGNYNNNGDSGMYYEKEGYASAPEEGDSNKRTHNKTLSSASFMRSLSSDDFLRQMNDEEAKESSAAVKIPQQQQQLRPQQQVPPQHPHPSYPPPMHSSSPVMMSYPPQAFHHPPTPPGSMPRYPTPPGSLTGYPTPPGSVTGYPTPPGSHAGTPPNYYAYGPPPPYGTPPQSTLWQQHQYPPPQDQRASPNLPMHYSPDPQASMQFHQQPPQPYQQVPPPPHMPSRGPADIQNGPPLLQQSMICQPAPKGNQTDKQKRSRRKCTVPDCPNRVVQGGLCISHGAKRKICSHPGCTKNVKKLGLCSAHGPARKKCEFEGCTKVAVQGGRCIAHGAKKRLCSFEECKKQAILGGMCKKHYDAVNGVVKQKKKAAPKQKQQPPSQGGGGHQRGLSIFQDSSVVDRIINNTAPPADNDGLHGLNI